MGYIQGQCGDDEKRNEPARRTTEAIERTTKEGRDTSAVEDSDDDE